MFGASEVFCSFSVNDLSQAREFYGRTLGLGVSEGPGPLWLHVKGSRIMIYAKPDHTPASFTVLNIPVDDIDEAVDELTSRGVALQRYQGFETDTKGIYRAEGHSIAWFNDPAGNGLSVVQER